MQNSNNNIVSEVEIDIFQQKLLNAKSTLENCQKEKVLKSCSLCKEYLECDIRRNYVQAVYDSMSKGETGGFEF